MFHMRLRNSCLYLRLSDTDKYCKSFTLSVPVGLWLIADIKPWHCSGVVCWPSETPTTASGRKSHLSVHLSSETYLVPESRKWCRIVFESHMIKNEIQHGGLHSVRNYTSENSCNVNKLLIFLQTTSIFIFLIRFCILRRKPKISHKYIFMEF